MQLTAFRRNAAFNLARIMQRSEIMYFQIDDRSCRKLCSTIRNLPLLTLYSKPSGCSLCDEAKRQLISLKDRVQLEEIDITLPENKKWFDMYCYDIPVLHLNGSFLMQHCLDTELLELSLRRVEVRTD